MTDKKDSDKNEPCVENYPMLNDWLEKHRARCNWQMPLGGVKKPAAYVESWIANGHEFIVRVNANQTGWEIYTACDSNSAPATLHDAELRLKISKDQERLDLLETVRKLHNMLDVAQSCMDDKNRKIFNNRIMDAMRCAKDVLTTSKK
jgi:hypothetical protein